ncbi:MAG: pyridoxal phosphate-dependent aminotransferase, partial [Burkholderiaceae bacterium]
MMSIEQTLAQARPAETMEVAQRVAQLRREGKDVISLAQGEPDFCTPEHIQQAAIDAMRAGKLGYTESAGLYVLREAIVSKLAADQKLAYSVEEISVTSGTKQAIFNAFFCSLTQGGEVVIPAPCWGSYPEVVKLTGGTPVIVECGAKAGFKIRPDDLERALSERTQWLMLNSPSNPTGAVYDPDELLAIAEVLRRHPHVRILSDDIYEKLVYGGTRFTQILEVAPDLRGRTLVVNGMSKCYSMTGWRLGYAAGAKDIISAMILVQGHSTSNANTASQYAAIAALTGDQSCVERFRKTFETRRDLTVAALRAIPGLDIATPD